MGRGDKKTKKGKRFKGSFGVHRPRKTSAFTKATVAAAK
jgi:ribosomal small subunit protein bTHX